MTDDAILVLQRELTPDATIVHCRGKLVLSTAEMFRVDVKPLIVPGGHVVLDLSGVTFMDSMGLGTIATLWVSSKGRSCGLVVTNLSPRIRDLFTVTHLLSLFEPCGGADARIP